jgi:hypothetical protein
MGDMKDWISSHRLGFWTALYGLGMFVLFLSCQAKLEGGMFGLGIYEAIICATIALVLYWSLVLPAIRPRNRP